MSLTVKKEIFNSSNLNGASTLPPFAAMDNVQNLTKSNLGEDDGLFIGYGFLANPFPYKMQDLYDRAAENKEYLTVTLENEYLKAVFLPDFGGRMWSLYDKKNDRELLYHNEAIRPCNLAVRNAWLAGGIEYNCGMVGHCPFTCDRMFTAVTKLEDGTPVLRMYQFERIRGIVYQMDFFLPDNSPLLYGRMRIVNPNHKVVPMYWWTNIAVPEGKEYRNIIAASSAYTNKGYVVSKVPVPEFEGNDITYPTNNPIAVDYFWKIPENRRKFTAYLDKNGEGFIQTSTSRLKGRKLFVWGQGSGGSRWQEFLTKDGNAGRYVEIQAGIANTQYECLPMPPKTAWEWLEGYGSISADPKKVHGDFAEASIEVEEKLKCIATEEQFDRLLADTHKMATSPAEKLVYAGDGWGKLENIRRAASNQELICEHLDFGKIDEEQEQWLYLLENGRFMDTDKNKLPVSWIKQDEWTELIKASPDSYSKYLNLAAVAFADTDFDLAEDYCNRALSYAETPAAWFIMSQVKRVKGDLKAAAELALKVGNTLSDDISAVRIALAAALSAEMYNEIITVYEALSNDIKADGRVTMLYCYALLRLGRVKDAEDKLNDNGGVCVADIREGEISITNLYIDIEEAKAKEKGIEFDRDRVSVPKKFDFRMFVKD